MQKRWTRPAAVLLALAVAAGSGACSVDSQSGITLNGVYGILIDSQKFTCTPQAEDQPLGGGFYDAGWGRFGQGYIVYLLIENNLPDNSDPSAGRLDSNDLALDSVEVSIDNSGPWRFLTGSQVIPVAGVVKTGAKLAVNVSIIGPSLANAILAGGKDSTGKALNSPIGNPGERFLLDVRLRIHGKLNDGNDVKSNELQFPITLANQVLAKDGACPQGEELAGCTIVPVLAGQGGVTDNTTRPVQYDGWICFKPT